MSVEISKMRECDSRAWADMRFKLWDSLSVDEHLVDIERMLKGGKRTSYIARLRNNVPVGFAEISIRDYANGCTAHPVAFLEGIWVDPKHRRKGVGRGLLAEITNGLLVQGFKELCSDAGIRDRRSHQAHADWGFTETDRVVYFRKALE
ncbi:aminoglycoside 6'-N-acetyltransferase I [Rhizobium sp. PP-F2F-G38]|uniref:GNAT family N-acetyltransferase n=1 Tax=Rhizobium sp. PP-CC-3G-465 TaxID=2135648 RepID=UPI000D88A7F7|nr:aminoglycoside 6'-N-acetyltransferase I [Rhizobium sp. PP-WC-1G-195]PYE39518.1 aminoglycoside 6'-N-acetyltransferase I [Rhizobium sp. PP-F2F-G20b]PYE93320.1 aminoglycoside 6'-N-acetyltransferase I [Rhizobium sp. PP-F2F-G38]TCL89429.1 aminoglycoside 6'-N-acetyltransferase I [Rhizobium sp. PP-WC-2G-219]TCP75328.1 aminoglycoside 6'-N-acetyltransferase I [Rhizobium sp. PP-CC-2G-626]TCQ02553.1 aminoglycoside 6'-N-acetyltransferase I [Rhizobium sp. PP-F2F-G36]TCQ17230.1 aminoglycoside 6'-N-acety